VLKVAVVAEVVLRLRRASSGLHHLVGVSLLILGNPYIVVMLVLLIIDE